MRPPLVGKLFDVTGDRLTPSHSRKTGKPLRCYISRRLVTDKREKHPDAWRLPARDLETGIARLLRDHLMKPSVGRRDSRAAGEAAVSGERLRPGRQRRSLSTAAAPRRGGTDQDARRGMR
jgi:hypothetical protein